MAAVEGKGQIDADGKLYIDTDGKAQADSASDESCCCEDITPGDNCEFCSDDPPPAQYSITFDSITLQTSCTDTSGASGYAKCGSSTLSGTYTLTQEYFGAPDPCGWGVEVSPPTVTWRQYVASDCSGSPIDATDPTIRIYLFKYFGTQFALYGFWYNGANMTGFALDNPHFFYEDKSQSSCNDSSIVFNNSLTLNGPAGYFGQGGTATVSPI